MPGDGHEMGGHCENCDAYRGAKAMLKGALKANENVRAENKRLREALKKLEAEVRGLPAFEAAVREAIGDTNFNILMERVRAALSPTSHE